MYKEFTVTDNCSGDPGESGQNALYVLAAIIILIILCIVFGGCKSVQYVPVIESHTDTVLITKHQRDSIYLRDSTHVSEKQKGDTVYLSIEKWHTQYKEKIVHDTVYHSRIDSIPKPYPVPKYIEKELSWWQSTRLRIANVVLIAALIAVGWWIFKKRAWWLALIKSII